MTVVGGRGPPRGREIGVLLAQDAYRGRYVSVGTVGTRTAVGMGGTCGDEGEESPVVA